MIKKGAKQSIFFWKKNIFMLPTCKTGTLFIEEMTRLLLYLVDGAAMCEIVFSAMPSLLLRKTSEKLKSKDLPIALQRRIELERKVNLWICSFCWGQEVIGWNFKEIYKQIKKENATIAIKILTNNRQSGILPLTKEALNHLKFKHAEAKVSSAEVLLDDVTRELNPIKFDAMNE